MQSTGERVALQEGCCAEARHQPRAFSWPVRAGEIGLEWRPLWEREERFQRKESANVMKKYGMIFATVLIFLAGAAAGQGSFSVGTASAAPGEKATGFLEVPAGVDAATSIPVVIIRGTKP